MKKLLNNKFLCFLFFCLCLNRPIFSVGSTPYHFIGEKIDFQLHDAKGKLHKLIDYRGKESIVCFIKSRIISDRCMLINYLSNVYNLLKEKDIMFFCVSTEPIENDYNGSRSIPFPILLDFDHEVSKKYKTCYDDEFALANTTFVLDKDGVVVKVFNEDTTGGIVCQIITHALGSNFGENEIKMGKCSSKKLVTEPSNFKVPDFELPGHDGKITRLSDYKGKYCLITFSNAISNYDEYEHLLYILDIIYLWLKKQNVEIICASTESVEKLARLKQLKDLSYRLISDTRYTIPEIFGESWIFYNGISSYLIDPKGNLAESFFSVSAELHLAKLCKYIIRNSEVL